MQGREKWERSRRQHRPPPPTRWIPPRAERAFQACWVIGYVTFVWEAWQIVSEEPADATEAAEAREVVPLLRVMTEHLRYVEWPADEEDLIHGTPMFERIAERADLDRRRSRTSGEQAERAADRAWWDPIAASTF